MNLILIVLLTFVLACQEVVVPLDPESAPISILLLGKDWLIPLGCQTEPFYPQITKEPCQIKAKIISLSFQCIDSDFAHQVRVTNPQNNEANEYISAWQNPFPLAGEFTDEGDILGGINWNLEQKGSFLHIEDLMTGSKGVLELIPQSGGNNYL